MTKSGIKQRAFRIFDQPISESGCGGSPYVSLDQAEVRHDFEHAMRCAFESGVNHFDTAQSYLGGQGETLFGACIEHWPREQFIVASTMALQKSKAATIAGVKASLHSLRIDDIDIYYIHWPCGDVDPRPMMEGLEDCRARGLLKGIGVSNFAVEQIELLRQAGTVDIVQFGYR